MPIQPGQRVDRYTVEALVGEGGMGRVYRAFDTRLERHVALKVLNAPDTGDAAEAIAFALREARAAAAIAHPNATAIYDAHEAGGVSFIVMELVSGTSLRELINGPQDGSGPILPPPLPTRLRWLVDIAGALAAAHRVGVIHRDVKPENVMVRDDGLVKVLDFGVARRTVIDAASSDEGTPRPPSFPSGARVAGTPAYMAPEQIRGEAIDGRADQFGWGVLAYELLTGRLPWRTAKDFVGYIAAVVTEEPVPPSTFASTIPPQVDAAILRALCKSPQDRFPSMSAAASELTPFAKASLTMSAVDPSAVSPTSSVLARAEARNEGAASGPKAPAEPTSRGERLSDDPGTDPGVFANRISTTVPSRGDRAAERPRAARDDQPADRPRAVRDDRLTDDPGTDPGVFASRIPIPSSSSRSAIAPPTPAREPLLPEPAASVRRFEVRRVPLREPRFDLPVDVAEHLALLPADASCKGMFFLDVVQLAARVMSPADLFRAAQVPERRIVAFRDYPMAEAMKLTVAAARALHPRSPLGEGLRRIGQTEFDAILETYIGRTLFGVLGGDIERVLCTGPKAFKLLVSFGTVTAEKTGPRGFAFQARGLPAFLETYQVGLLEGVLRHYKVRGEIRIALEDLANATLELKLI